MALFFGQWLVGRGCITPEQLLAALDIQLETNRELGPFAVDTRVLEKSQVEEIQKELRNTDRRFSEIAIEREWLTKDQFDRLFERQRGVRRYIGEILVEEGYLEFQQMMSELAAFRAEKRAEDADDDDELNIAALMNETSETEAYLSACVAMFQRVARQKLQLDRMEEGAVPNHEYTVVQVIDTDANAYIALSMPEKEMLHIATSMVGQTFDTVNQTVLEAAKEMLNVIMGNVAGWLSVDGKEFSPQPPQIVLNASDLPPAARSVTYFLAGAKNPLQLIVGL